MTSDTANTARMTMSHKPMTARHSKNGILYWLENFGRGSKRVREEGREGGREGGKERGEGGGSRGGGRKGGGKEGRRGGGR